MRPLHPLAGARAGQILAAVVLLPSAASLAEPASPGPWHATPLVTTTSSISDLAGGRFVDFGQVFVRPDGEVVFWAKLAGREEKRSWALFSLRDGVVRTILEEGEEVTSRYSAEVGRKFHVHHEGQLHSPLFLYEGELLCFTSHPGVLMKDAGVFGWDGERIRTLLIPGQTITLGGRAETIESAWGGAAQTGGGIMVSVRTAKPSKRTLQAILLNGVLRLLDSGERAAGSGLPAWIEEQLGTGKSFPFEAGRTVIGTNFLRRQSETRWVLTVITDDRQQHYVYTDGTRLFDLNPPGLSREKNWSFAIDQVEFLGPEQPLVVYRGQTTYRKEKPYASTQIFLFDGGAVRPLIDAPIFDASGRTRIDRLTGGRFPGALIHALRGGVPGGAIPDEWPLWFLSRDSLSAGLQPVPDIALEGGRTISLEDVRAWPSESVAIAAVADGIYRLEEISSSGP